MDSVRPVNDNIKSIMFGAQKQANRINDAAVRFVERCMLERGAFTPGEHVNYNDMVSRLSKVIRDSACAMFSEEGASLSDKTLVNLLVDHKTLHNASSNCIVGISIISGAGKVHFTLRREGEEYDVPQYESSVVEKERRAAAREDDAMDLVKKILAHCPNRSDYPEDDVLAAITYGKIYWKEVQE